MVFLKQANVQIYRKAGYKMSYKEYIKECIGSEPSENSAEEAYKVLPAMMRQDTEEGKKENYNAIRDHFKAIDERFYREHQEVLLPKAGLYLLSLIDTMSVMSQEIFEHYKYFEGLYKRALRTVLSYYDEEAGMFPERLDIPAGGSNPPDMAGSFLISCAILKGCRMKAILSEKYLEIGKTIYETAAAMAAEEEITGMPREMQLAFDEYQRAAQ